MGLGRLDHPPDPNFRVCAGNNGIHFLDANGRYATILAARWRPKVTLGLGMGNTSAQEYKATAEGLFAQFGTWSLDGVTITYHVDGALFPNIEGTDFAKLTVNISGDELKPFGECGPQGVWRRVKP